MLRLTDFTINRALKRHGFVTVKAKLHQVFLFSLSKKGHYGTLFFYEHRLYSEENETNIDNCQCNREATLAKQWLKLCFHQKKRLKSSVLEHLRYTKND